MRLRNERLSTGHLLARFNPDRRPDNCSLLFLVSGTRDIAPLQAVERASKPLMDPSFEWHAVADQRELSSVDPDLDPARIARLEACEFAGLEDGEVCGLLSPALERLSQGSTTVFPTAHGAVGGVAEGVQFLDREGDLQALRTAVEEGTPVLLVAPRRAGKTSLMRRLEWEIRDRFRPLFLDLERIRQPMDLSVRARAVVSGRSVREVRNEAGAHRWDSVLRQLLEGLAGSDGTPAVLLLDEMAWGLKNLIATADDQASAAQVARAFLEGLDAATQGLDVRWVLAGSIDLSTFLEEELGLALEDVPGPLGRLARQPLRPLQADSLKVELRRVLIGTGLVPEAGDLEWLAGHVDLAAPYPAMAFLSRLYSRIHSGKGVPAGQLDQELDQFLNSTDAFREFTEGLRRKQADDPAAVGSAASALDRLTEFEDLPESDLVDSLGGAEIGRKRLEWMIETFPLTRDADRVRCASRLFRHWWSRQGL